jgi:hypothetical protein
MFENKKYHGMYRGIVVSNIDPEEKGRIKVFVPGVYPDKFHSDPKSLPWAEPAMPIFGGSYKSLKGSAQSETGITSPPHVDANLFCFFEQGDHMHPIYAFAVQSGEGWMSEHENQHVIQTDNVKIRIDENPNDERSTSHFPSYNTKCTYTSQPDAISDIPTRVDIDITGPTNLIINGSLNMQVNGNVYKEINGDLHETIVGNHYKKVVGDIHIEHEGAKLLERTGNVHRTNNGSARDIVIGNRDSTVNGDASDVITGKDIQNVGVQQLINTATRTVTVIGAHTINTIGTRSDLTTGTKYDTTTGSHIITVTPGPGINAFVGEFVVTAFNIRLN